MKTPASAKLIAECWLKAEETLRDAIRSEFADRDEEFVTELFHGKLETECNRANVAGEAAKAFLQDLRLSLPTVPAEELSKIARGLNVAVHFHSREIERKTGGDFGITLIRPEVRFARYSHSTLTVERDHQRGLLCQAKIFRRSSTWGPLTVSQQKVLSERLEYVALVLYRFTDQGRRELAPFQWQLTRASSMNDMKSWLASDTFPSLQGSKEILHAIGQNRIGTSDKEIIAKYITTPVRPTLIIRLQWPDGAGPGATVQLREFQQKQQVVLHQRI
jgi:hypothetical protein